MHILKTLMLSAAFPAMAVAAPSLSSPEAGTAGQSVNTAQAWEIAAETHTLIGQGGLPLKTEERSLWESWRSGRLSTLPVLAWGDGAVICPLGLTIPILQTSPGYFSVVELNKGAVPSGMMGAPETQWIVKTAVAGHHAIIAISPRFAGLTGNLQIFATGPRGHSLTYTIGLASGQDRYTPKLSFYRNDSNPTTIHLPPATQNTETEADETGTPTYRSGSDPEIVASKLSVNWKQQCVIGDCNVLMPVVVANTRTQTFIRFPAALKTPPMVLPENRQGRSWYAPSHLTAGGKTLVVDAAPWRLDLLQPDSHHQMTEVRLTQGEDKGGTQ